MSLARAATAELVGTALLVVGGVGTAVLAGDTVGDLGVALAFGLTLLALVAALGPASGAHLNPAVTLGLAVDRRVTPATAGVYVLAQLAGGLAGAGLVAALAAGRPGFDVATDGLGTNGYGAGSPGGFGLPAVLSAEIVLTAVLVLVVLAVTGRGAGPGPVAVPIGMTLAVLHLVAIPIDGTSVNPARSLGPALLTGGPALAQVWVFLVAPLGGALLAAALHRFVFPAADRAPATPGSRPMR